jgi:succinyl-diaminopimelate desuccinylase
MPERGVNAIYKAARAVTKLEHFGFAAKPHPVLGSPTLNVGTINGGLNVNSVPDAATIGIDIRTIPDQDHGALLKTLTEYLGDEVTLEPMVDAEGSGRIPRILGCRRYSTSLRRSWARVRRRGPRPTTPMPRR